MKLILIESLEQRELLSSAAIVNGTLVVRGDDNRPNIIGVTMNGSSRKIAVTVNGRMTRFSELPTEKVNINGGNRNDLIIFHGNKLAGKIYGIGLSGWDGNDFIVSSSDARVDHNGGSGNDVLVSGSSGDWLQGDDGNDLLIGNGGSDTISPGTGNDRIFAGSGDDFIYAVPDETDIIDGGTGNDTIWSYGLTPIKSSFSNVELVDYDNTAFA